MLNLRSNADMDMHAHRRNRLQTLIEDQYDGDRQVFCDAADLSESRLAQLLSTTYRDGQGFGEKAARTLETRLDLSELFFDLLAVGEISDREAYQQRAKTGDKTDDTVQIRQVSLTLTAGSAHIKTENEEPSLCAWHFQKSWLKERNLTADKLMAITVDGASMSPSLKDGDVVLVNTADTERKDSAVYLINYQGDVVIKRLTLDFGRWHLSSDNTNRKQYQRQELDEDTCIVIGRIILMASERL